MARMAQCINVRTILTKGLATHSQAHAVNADMLTRLGSFLIAQNANSGNMKEKWKAAEQFVSIRLQRNVGPKLNTQVGATLNRRGTNQLQAARYGLRNPGVVSAESMTSVSVKPHVSQSKKRCK